MTDLEKRILQLTREKEELRVRLRESEETLDAIRGGEVDAVVVDGPQGQQIFSLHGVDHCYRMLIEEMQEGAVTLDKTGTILHANKFMARMLRMPLEKIIGGTLDRFVHTSDIPAYDALLKRSETGCSYAEVKLRTDDGGSIPACLSASRISLDNVSLFCLVGTDRVTREHHERILAEERLSRSIIEQSRDMIIVCDNQGRVIRASRMAFDLMGRNILNEPFNDVFHIHAHNPAETGSNQRPRSEIFTIEPVLAGKRFHSLEVFVHKTGDSPIPSLLSAAPLLNDVCKVAGCIVNLTDITRIKELEAQIVQSHKVEAIGTLAGGIAHDFNNILGIVLGNTELAMDDVPHWNPATLNLEEIKKACLRAKDVVTQILSFSRKSDIMHKPLNMASAVSESMKLLRASIPTSIHMRQDIPNDISNITGDPTQIQQIMINLCTNAVHSMDNGAGLLEVTLENRMIDKNTASRDFKVNPGPHVELRVRDTGKGMAPEIMKRIFDPYFTTKDVGKGTGLGLSVVHGIVKSHGGEIFVESIPGKGSTFRILFPALMKGKVKIAEDLNGLPTGKERILFVDDEDSMVKLNRQRLAKLGYGVIPKTDPLEALEFFKTHADQIDLVITDMTMPHMTGDKLIQEILKIRPHMPIILCTGFSERISNESALKLGVRNYLEKPFEMNKLARTVRDALYEK